MNYESAVLHLSLHTSELNVDTYGDIRVQRLAVVLHILLTDVQHVHLRTGHHDPDQCFVFGASSLRRHTKKPNTAINET